MERDDVLLIYENPAYSFAITDYELVTSCDYAGAGNNDNMVHWFCLYVTFSCRDL